MMTYRVGVPTSLPALAIGCLLAGTVVSTLTPAPSAHAADGPRAVASWSMVPQSKDANNDGFIDGDGGVPSSGALSLSPSTTFKGAGNFIAQPNERLIKGSLSWYLDQEGFPVRLNACSSTGTDFRWTIQRGNRVIERTPFTTLTKRSCKQTVTLPEGLHSIKLTVRDNSRSPQNPRKSQTSLIANISNTLLVVMGDSYASGEGNPRNVDAWLDNRGSPFRPYWDEPRCNRSVHGAPAQAALALEKSSAKTSVTLVDVSCSGATIDKGILGSQQRGLTSQIDQVKEIVGSSGIDAIYLSIGGNDVGFTNILTTCALRNDCPEAQSDSPPLDAFPSLNDGIQELTAKLAADYTRLDRAFRSLPLAPSAKIYLGSYPDLTRSQTGEVCSYLTITRSDFSWARSTILDPTPTNPYIYRTTRNQDVELATGAGSLNGQIKRTTTLGWTPVMGIWNASGAGTTGHGVCAGSEAWIFGLTGIAGFTSGSFHPNPAGQKEFSQQIFTAMSPRSR